MCMCGTGSSILLGFVNAREVGVSSRNLVSRTFPQIFQSMLTPMFYAFSYCFLKPGSGVYSPRPIGLPGYLQKLFRNVT